MSALYATCNSLLLIISSQFFKVVMTVSLELLDSS